MMHTIVRRIVRIGVLSVIGVVAINSRFVRSTSEQIVMADDADPQYDIALVLGASVRPDGTLSTILQDRIDTAISLYEQGVVDRLLVSGDNGQIEYNEVAGMSRYLLDVGIPAEAIFQDYAGFDTYDSVYRAREIFAVESMIIVTQEFHLPRAVAIANDLDLDVQGVMADRREYPDLLRMQLRESGARLKAFGEIVFGSRAKFGGEVIDIEGESNTKARNKEQRIRNR